MEEIIAEVLTKAKFTKPVRAVYLYSPHEDKGPKSEAEFRQAFLPSLLIDKNEIDKRKLSKDDIDRKWQKDIENKFCTIKRQEDHINSLNQLSSELEIWCEENNIPLGSNFIAARILGLLCPHPSKVHYNKDMTVSHGEQEQTEENTQMEVRSVSHLVS